MFIIFVIALVLGCIFLNLDKLKYLKYFAQFIWGAIESIPTLMYAGLKLIEAGLHLAKAGLLFSFYLVLTWGFFPLALWLMYSVEVKPYTH